jgi:hypothetical protein
MSEQQCHSAQSSCWRRNLFHLHPGDHVLLFCSGLNEQAPGWGQMAWVGEDAEVGVGDALHGAADKMVVLVAEMNLVVTQRNPPEPTKTHHHQFM